MKLASLKKIGQRLTTQYNNAIAKVATIFTVAIMSAPALAADYNFDTLVENGQSAEDVASNAENLMKIFFNVIKALGVAVGFWLVYLGVMRIKKANEPNSQTTPMQGILFIALGGCLGALPFIFLSSATIVQG